MSSSSREGRRLPGSDGAGHPVAKRPAVGSLPGPDEVHVWWASLGLPDREMLPLSTSLSPDERTRARRFRFDRDRRRFVAGRGLLRHLVGAYLDRPPSLIGFRYGHAGKPEVSDVRGALRFNLSHSGDRALFAFTCGREVGVDVEHARAIDDADLVAIRFFSDSERRSLAALAGREKRRAFYRCWTRKEAYLKGLGDGLARPLDGFDVSLGPGDAARLLAVRGNDSEASRWSLEDLPRDEDHAAALAVVGPRPRLSTWELPAAGAAAPIASEAFER